MSVKRAAAFSGVALSLLSVLFFIYYELNLDLQDPLHPDSGLANRVQILQTKFTEMEHQVVNQLLDPVHDAVKRLRHAAMPDKEDDDDVAVEVGEPPNEAIVEVPLHEPVEHHEDPGKTLGNMDIAKPVVKESQSKEAENKMISMNNLINDKKRRKELTKRGTLMCNGKETDSEVIYWKVVPGDVLFESPITPHHNNHEDRYLTFEYDQGTPPFEFE